MTVPDATILGGIGAVAVYAAYYTKRIADSYFTDVKAMRERLSEHCQENADEHNRQISALDQIIRRLEKLNGGAK